MIGKYTILVASTSIRSSVVGAAGTGFIAVATDMETATIKILNPKCISAISTITASFFIILIRYMVLHKDADHRWKDEWHHLDQCARLSILDFYTALKWYDAEI